MVNEAAKDKRSSVVYYVVMRLVDDEQEMCEGKSWRGT